MGLHHPFMRDQFWLPLREGDLGLNATGMVPNSNVVDFTLCHHFPRSVDTVCMLHWESFMTVRLFIRLAASGTEVTFSSQYERASAQFQIVRKENLLGAMHYSAL
jgi:hypothetical protein